ncbi:MAG: hypothetical protein AAF639_35105 [Chloroflexota bacterium]
MSVWSKQYPNAPLHEPAGAWFVNRKDELNLLWKWACKIPDKGSRSITGLRRTGKSSLIAKLYNRLYFEQERVMPIYITLARYLHRTEPMTSEEFVDIFFEGAVRSYLTFQYKRPEFQQDITLDLAELHIIAQELADETALKWFQRYYRTDTLSRVPSHNRVQWAINFLKSHAYLKPQPMVIMIDEFQLLTEVKMMDDGRVTNITGSFQRASESWDAPLLVSGSSMYALREKALGGLLSGRFGQTHIGPLEPEHAVHMVFLLGEHLGIPVTEEFSVGIAVAAEGFPFLIESILRSSSHLVQRFPDTSVIQYILEYELSDNQGSLREYYYQEYGKYLAALSDDYTICEVLHWITDDTFELPEITASRIANITGLDCSDVQESLNTLYGLDIIQRKIGMIYSPPRDPLMRIYLNSYYGKRAYGKRAKV